MGKNLHTIRSHVLEKLQLYITVSVCGVGIRWSSSSISRSLSVLSYCPPSLNSKSEDASTSHKLEARRLEDGRNLTSHSPPPKLLVTAKAIPSPFLYESRCSTQSPFGLSDRLPTCPHYPLNQVFQFRTIIFFYIVLSSRSAIILTKPTWPN